MTALWTAMLCATLAVPASAANRVTEIAVDVTLEQDGSAYVVQEWRGSFDEDTECYFPVTNLGDMTLSDLKVSDGSGTYTTLDKWDTGASFEEKAGKCGLNPVEGGYEVCWGITEYGENRYAVEYRLDGLMAAYGDGDGFLFQFVPEGINTGPTDVTVRIHTRDGWALTEENAAVWAFDFEGQAGFADNGGVLAYTEMPLDADNSVILMLRLEKGLLTPARTVTGSFEEVKTCALEGSDYGEDEGGGMILLVLIAVVAVGLPVLVWVSGKEGRRIKKLAKTADYWREAPIGGNLEASFVLASQFHQSDDEGSLIAATLIRLLGSECLEPLTQTGTGFMGQEKELVSLRLVKPPAQGLTASSLYDLLVLAAGNDGVLQEQELERYCKTNYTALLSVVQEAKRDGSDTLRGVKCYKSGLDTETLAGLTDRGRTLLLQLIGYKKYLLDFSLIGERGANEALIWQDCLTYAALLGIGEQVLGELRKLYPSVDTNFQAAQSTYYMACRYNIVTYGAAKSTQSAANRASGGGGHSSLSGGSGFSGGGSGGGTR